MIAWTPFAAGLAGGLGIALPLGAIGVLILREGVERGIRAAGVAALAVATVDFGYALMAVAVGGRITEVLSGVERAVQLLGALALVVVVLVGVRDLLSSTRARTTHESPGPSERPEAGEILELPVGYRRTFLRFVGLTVINPMTAVYFVALTTGLSEHLAGSGAGVAFAAGVFLGSLAWQLVLAVSGATAGSRMSERVRIGVSLTGYAIVAAYALKLVLGA